MKHISKLSIIIIGIGLYLGAWAQTPPGNMVYSEHTHILSTGNQVLSDFYNDTQLHSIYLEFQDEDYWEMLHEVTGTDDYVMATLIYGNDILDSVGVQFKGQTSYSQIVNEEKLSFDISLNHFVDGQDIEGYNTLNLNNAYEDDSFMKEVMYLNLNRYNIPAAQGNFVKLYINNEYWGIYNNIQQLNKDFTKEWFMTNNGSLWRADVATNDIGSGDPGAGGPGGGGPGGGGPGGGGPGGGTQWGDGTAALNYLGNDIADYEQYYTLKSSDQDNAWELLKNVTYVLNNTARSDLYDSISKYINIDRTLWFLAHEIIFSDDDSYVHKGKMDYYLYYEPETELFVPLEFDGNSAMDIRNVNWDVFYNEDNVNYPLMNLLFSIPELRQRYLAHVRSIVEELLDEDKTDSILDRYYNLISDAVYDDSKKLCSNQEFETSFEDLKAFIEQRKTFINSNTEVNIAPLTINEVVHRANAYDFSTPNENEEVEVVAKISGSLDIKTVNLYYAEGYVGNFTKKEMTELESGVYESTIPGFEAGRYVRYYIEAVADDEANTVSYAPIGAEHDVYFYRVNVAEIEYSDVVINEVVASNNASAFDEDVESDDWIELYNNSSQAIALSGYYLSDNASDLTKWPLPNIIIEANSYVVIWADNDEEQGELHANFKLSADGEELFLVNPSLKIADQLFFTKQNTDVSYGRLPNGTGLFQKLEPTYSAENSQAYIRTTVNNIKSGNVKLYPNPANQFIYIESAEPESYRFEIFDIFGRCIRPLVEFNNSIQINLTNYRTGVYFVKMYENDMVNVYKFVVE